ncbi:barstar family protein [Blastococcus sp. SYSU D00820]
MTTGRPCVHGELPWLTGPLHRVHGSARTEVDAFLDRFPYRRIHLDGRAMTSRPAAHRELARAFAFPEYYGHNWDAFDDCWEDFAMNHSGQLVAVVWDHVDVAARAAPATTVEVGWALLERSATSTGRLVAFDVFAVGDGDDFDRPT